MRRYTVSSLLILAIMSVFWAYTIVDTLLRKFSKEITWVDLGAIFVLGFISGGAFGLAWALGQKSPKRVFLKWSFLSCPSAVVGHPE